MTRMATSTLRPSELFASGGVRRRERDAAMAADSARFGRGLVVALLVSAAVWLGGALALVG